VLPGTGAGVFTASSVVLLVAFDVVTKVNEVVEPARRPARATNEAWFLLQVVKGVRGGGHVNACIRASLIHSHSFSLIFFSKGGRDILIWPGEVLMAR
jgi:hypothetical protein